MRTILLAALFLIIPFGNLIYAQINGPIQPDYTNFTPISGSDMVDTYTGQFRYSIPVITIPGPDGSGYTLSLGYNSNNKPDDEASWVGYGWTLNPGAISRNKRGFPDEFNGVEVIYYKKRLRNQTRTVYPSTAMEFYSVDENPDTGEGSLSPGFNLSLSMILSHNNYTGYKRTFSLGGGHDYASGNFTTSSDGSYSISANSRYLVRELSNSIYPEIKGEDQKGWSGFLRNSVKSYANRLPAAGINSLNWLVNSRGAFPVSADNYKVDVVGFSPGLRLDGFLGVGLDMTYGWSTTDITYDPVVTRKANGYLHSDKGFSDGKTLMDYFVFNERTVKEDDAFLHIPFSNADDFSVSGNGIAGSFRAWSNQAGTFRPDNSESETYSDDAGATGSVGPGGWGFGGNYSYGDGRQKQSPWWNGDTDATGGPDFAAAGPDSNRSNFVFKFRNDPTGWIDYYDSENHPDRFSPFAQSFHSFNNLSQVYGHRLSSSSGPNVDTEGFYRASKKIEPKYFGISDNSEALHIPENLPELSGIGKGMIVGFRITSENGIVYEYHQPIFNREEKNISYSINNANQSQEENYTNDNYIIYQNISDENTIVNKRGEYVSEPYATTYLLTAIYSPDYVDLSGDGPSNDDLGSWTRFEYERSAGSNDKSDSSQEWFFWRKPYSGLYYNRGELSNKLDDTGMFSAGEKELYYLSTIETKSHIAYFINNKTSFNIALQSQDGVSVDTIAVEAERDDNGKFLERLDSYPADSDASAAWIRAEPWEEDPDIPTPNPSRYLERIELYAKDPSDPNLHTELLSTTNFQYDGSYPIWTGQLSSFQNKGKLTLTGIWTDHADLQTTYISTYRFGYTYPGSSDYPGRYSHLATEYAGLDELPTYNYLDTDVWGYYATDGASPSGGTPIASIGNGSILSNIEDSRKYKMKDWVDQLPDHSDFDPAAYNLKTIDLPSDGQIHIQYERNKYTSVQDRLPMIMVPIKEGVAMGNGEYIIDLSKSIDTTGLDLASYASILDSILKRDRLYFRFLYGISQDDGQVDMSHCPSEIIRGWSSVESVTFTGGEIKIQTRLTKGTDGGDIPIPRKMCEVMVVEQRSGIYSKGSIENCDPCNGDHGVAFNYDAEAKDPWGADIANLNEDICRYYSPSDSYLRLPLPEAMEKKGGGIRVKRILMLDKFNSLTGEGENNLYGTEYVYKKATPLGLVGSGVAANEPEIDVSNSLRSFLGTRAPLDDTQMDKIGIKTDIPVSIEQYEGPLCKPLLPSALVTYADVTSKSIYEGPNTNGFNIDSYITYRDLPYDFKMRDTFQGADRLVEGIDYTNPAFDDPSLNIPMLYSYMGTFALQGYQFITHGLIGQKKSNHLYAGSYSDYIIDPLNARITSGTTYEYFNPVEPIPLYRGDTIEYGFRGLDMDIFGESRYTEQHNLNAGGDIDVNFTWALAFTGSANITGDYSESEAGTYVTTKIISLPVFVKSVETTTDGVSSKVENIAFDPITGSPVLTTAYDDYSDITDGLGYQGQINTFNLMAHSHYQELGEKSFGDGKVIQSVEYNRVLRLVANDTSAVIYPSYSYGENQWGGDFHEPLTKGDIIEVYPSQANPDFTRSYLYTIDHITPIGIALQPLDSSDTFSGLLRNVDIRIVKKSGQHQLGLSVGQVTTYGDLELPSTNYYGIDTARITERQTLVDTMNVILSSSRDTTINLVDIVPNIKIISPDGDTITGSEVSLIFNFSDLVQVSPNDPYVASLYDYRYYDPTDTISHAFFEISYVYNSKTFTQADMMPRYNEIVTDLNALLDSNYKFIPLSDYQLNSMRLDNNDAQLSNIFDDMGDHEIRQVKLRESDYYELTGLNKILDAHYLRQGTYQKGNDILNIEESSIGSVYLYKDETDSAFVKPDIPLEDESGNRMFARLNFSGYLTKEEQETNFLSIPTYVSNVDSTVYTSSRGYFEFTDMDLMYRYIPDNQYDKDFGEFIDTNDIVIADTCKFGHERRYVTYDSVNPAVFDTIPNSIYWTNAEFVLGWSGEIEIDTRAGLPDGLPDTMIHRPLIDTVFPYHFYRHFACLDFDDEVSLAWQFENVLSITNSTLSDDNPISFEEYGIDPGTVPQNDVLNKRKGVWRPQGNYVYETGRNSGGLDPYSAAQTGRNYITGKYADGIGVDGSIYTVKTINWMNPERSIDQWIKGGDIIQYSPFGEVTEAYDINEIATSARYNEITKMPAYTASNAEYGSVLFFDFEDFEPVDIPGYGVQTDFTVDSISHTGNKSYRLATDSTIRLTNYYTPNFLVDTLSDEKGLIRAWVYVDDASLGRTPEILVRLTTPFGIPTAHCPTHEIIVALDSVASSNGWVLMEGITGTDCHFPDEIPFVSIQTTDTTANIFIDDFLIQPYSAETTTYVYDQGVTNRILAQFDPNHFPTLYRYDYENRLSGITKQTSKGRRLVSETDYNSPNSIRPARPGVDQSYLVAAPPMAPSINIGLSEQKGIMPKGMSLKEWKKSFYSLDSRSQNQFVNNRRREQRAISDSIERTGIEMKSKLLELKISRDRKSIQLLDGIINTPLENDSLPGLPAIPESPFLMDSLKHETKDLPEINQPQIPDFRFDTDSLEKPSMNSIVKPLGTIPDSTEIKKRIKERLLEQTRKK